MTTTLPPAAGDELLIRYIPLDTLIQWERNPKRHGLDNLMASIEQYGFKMPARYEPHINGPGQGGIAAGNGRIQALRLLRERGRPAPRGIQVTDAGWAVPVIFGVNADSQNTAESFAVDDNNLPFVGLVPVAALDQLWEADLLNQVLEGLDLSPITIDLHALGGLPTYQEIPVGGAAGTGTTVIPMQGTSPTHSAPPIPAPAFRPNLAPTTSAAPVTAAQVATAQDRLDHRFDKRMPLKPVVCPHCAEEFFLPAEEVRS